MTLQTGAAEMTALLHLLTSQNTATDERLIVQRLVFKGLVVETASGLALSESGRAIAMDEARRRNLLTPSAR